MGRTVESIEELEALSSDLSQKLTETFVKHANSEYGSKIFIENKQSQPSIKYDKPLGLRTKAVIRQYLTVVLANLAVLSAGMALGYPAITLNQLKDPNQSPHLTDSQASWFASINSMICPLGGLLSSILLDKIGRKWTILLINLSAILSWGLMMIDLKLSAEGVFIQIMISRFIIGITTGLASAPVGVYSAEVCHADLRGRLTLGTSISTAAGIFIIYVLGYFIRNDWRLISCIACAISIFGLLVAIKIPDSPSWLIMKGRIDQAEVSLKFFRGISKHDNTRNVEFQSEFQNLLKSIQTNSDKKQISKIAMLQLPEVYKPLLIMIGFFAFQQFGGIFVIIVYAVDFAIEANVTIDPVICAILIGLTRLLTTFLVGLILDKWGRRPPAILSGVGMSLCMLTLASKSWFNFTLPYLSVFCIIMYIFTSTFGLMTLPFSMISEVYPQRIRGFAAGITICCGFLMSFITIKIYPNMVITMGRENVFAFYGIVSIFAIIYIYMYLPETKGKTLAEIEAYFRNDAVKDDKQHTNDKEIEMKEIFIRK